MERAGNGAQPNTGIELAQLRAEIAKLRPAAELAAGYALKMQETDETSKQILQGLKALIGKLEEDGDGKPIPVPDVASPLKLSVKAPPQLLVILG